MFLPWPTNANTIGFLPSSQITLQIVFLTLKPHASYLLFFQNHQYYSACHLKYKSIEFLHIKCTFPIFLISTHLCSLVSLFIL